MSKKKGGRFTCNACDKKFDEPAEIGNGLGYCSPCCEHHFTDENEDRGTVCCSTCCENSEPLFKEEAK